MKKFNLLTLLCAILLIGAMQSCNQTPVIEGENYAFQDGMIVFDEPARPLSKEDVQREAILKALKRNGGKRKDAAKELFMSERTLYRKIKDLGIDEI